MSNSNSATLIFKAIREKLDWNGNVVEDVQTAKYDWTNYDSKAFLNSIISQGDLSSISAPTDKKYAIDFFLKVFDVDSSAKWCNYDILQKYKVIESEPFNGYKFVIYDRLGKKQMKWVSEEEPSNGK